MPHTYEINGFYGVHFDYAIYDNIIDVLAKSKYSELVDNVYVVDGCEIYLGTNSDIDEPTNGFITTDELCIASFEFERPADSYLAIDDSEMSILVGDNERVVKALREIYNYLRDQLSEKNISDEVRFGWSIMNCTWDE